MLCVCTSGIVGGTVNNVVRRICCVPLCKTDPNAGDLVTDSVSYNNQCARMRRRRGAVGRGGWTCPPPAVRTAASTTPPPSSAATFAKGTTFIFYINIPLHFQEQIFGQIFVRTQSVPPFLCLIRNLYKKQEGIVFGYCCIILFT